MQSKTLSRIAAAGLAAGAALLLLPSVAAADHREHRRGHERYQRAPVHQHGPWCASRHAVGHGHRSRHFDPGYAFHYGFHHWRYKQPHRRYAHPHPHYGHHPRFQRPHRDSKRHFRKHFRRHDRHDRRDRH